jgi:hypothetical protein
MLVSRASPAEIREQERVNREREAELKAMTKEERLEACRAYVKATLERGEDLHVTFWPHWINEGHVMVGHSRGGPDHTKPYPKHYLDDFMRDELVAVLEPLGKVFRWQDKMPWEFGASRKRAMDTRSAAQIVGDRLEEARRALEMDIPTFYGPAGMMEKTALKWESGEIHSRFIEPGGRLKALSEAHSIPIEWLIYFDRFDDPGEETSTKEAHAS